MSSDVRLNEKTFKSYLKFREFLFGGFVKAESYAIFIDKIREKIFSEILSKENLSHLDNKPLNPIILKELLERNNRQISLTSTKNLLTLLMKVSLIDQIPIIKIITISNEDAQNKQLIYNYLLRSKNTLNVKKVKKNFKDSPQVHRINDYLIELWIENKIDISGIDIPREILNDKSYKDLPPKQIKEYKSIETYRIRETGELKARITLSDNYKLFPKGD
ncbi:MAG: hypothetical protein P8Y70_19340 [Candidatus Lokiarchaeota archaeon]